MTDTRSLDELQAEAVKGLIEAYDRGFEQGFAASQTLALENVAKWMIARSYATGHGDTIENMLAELVAQAVERGHD